MKKRDFLAASALGASHWVAWARYGPSTTPTALPTWPPSRSANDSRCVPGRSTISTCRRPEGLVVVILALVTHSRNDHGVVVGNLKQGDVAGTAKWNHQFPQERALIGLAAGKG